MAGEKKTKEKEKTNEMLIAVNRMDNIIKPVERFKAHSGDGVLHRAFLTTVKNYENEIYLTQRSEKRPDLPPTFPAPFPLYWDGSIAGHPRYGQKGYKTQVLKELEEELNLKAGKNQVRWLGRFYYSDLDPFSGLREIEVCAALLLYTNQEPKISPVELSQGEWVYADDVRKEVMLVRRRFSPWFIEAQKRYPEIYEFNPKTKV